MIHTNYDSTNGIITIVKSGTIDFEQALSMLDVIDGKYGENDKLYLLEDSSTCRYNIRPAEIKKLLTAINSKINKYIEVRHADVVSTPIETALSLVYAAGAKFISNYSYKSFTTQTAAINWIQKGVYYNKLK